jgi:hypothetical protein
MTDKEPLEQLIVHIGDLSALVEGIHEREIYPVSFFSQAFDLTYKIQHDLHQVEIAQIKLFEQQMKEHQAQILSIVRQPEKAPESPVPPPLPLASPPSPPSPPPPLPPETEKEEHSLNASFKKKKIPDLRKAFSLNDRFRFGRGLFARDETLMNRTIAELNDLDSYQASVSYLKERFDWNMEAEDVADFLQLLEKRFS